MTHGSLFSGIGGFDLAAEWMGWENIFHCEINPFGRKVLNHYWPNAISYEDITKTDFSIHRGAIDVLTGGFPCQPYSVAGLRKGKDDERHLWPEMLRAIREIKPRWIVGENVLGLASWNGGMVFEEVQTDLEAEGYEVQPYVLPAASVGAPHRRDRIWFVAYCSDSGVEGLRESKKCDYGFEHVADTNDKRFPKFDIPKITNQTEFGGGEFFNEQQFSSNSNNYGPHGTENRQSVEQGDDGNKTGKIKAEQFERCTHKSSAFITDAHDKECFRRTGNFEQEWKKDGQVGKRMERTVTRHGKKQSFAYTPCIGLRRQSNRIGKSRFSYKKNQIDDWQNFPTQPPVRDGNDGISSQLDGITFPKWRNESIKGGGNAVVPQVVLQIFKAIELSNLKE